MRRAETLEILEEHREDLARFGVESLRLFGSVARDEASDESGVDLVVGFHGTSTFSNFMKLRIFLEDLFGTEVDLVTERGLRERVRPYVDSEAIIARANKPLVKLVPVEEVRPPRRLGTAAGQMWVSEDFDEPLSDFDEHR